MTPEYLAGFLDGEGCIDFIRDVRRDTLCARIRISNTHLGVVKVIQSTFGGKLYDLPLMPRNRQKYEVTWSGKQAEKVLELVLPFMIIKRAQALLVLDAMRNQRTSRTSLRAGLSLEQRTKNNAANLQIRELNRVGKPN